MQASGNSVRNAHIESFWDGVQIGSTATPVKSVELSNISTATKAVFQTYGSTYGQVTNSVHICGTNTNTVALSCFGTTPSTQSADVSIFGVSNYAANTANLVRDDVSNDSVLAANINTYDPMGMYRLGASMSVGNSNTANSIFTSASSSGLPTWVVGNGPPSTTISCATTPGAIYSNTKTTGPYTIYVCTNGVWKGLI